MLTSPIALILIAYRRTWRIVLAFKLKLKSVLITVEVLFTISGWWSPKLEANIINNFANYRKDILRDNQLSPWYLKKSMAFKLVIRRFQSLINWNHLNAACFFCLVVLLSFSNHWNQFILRINLRSHSVVKGVTSFMCIRTSVVS